MKKILLLIVMSVLMSTMVFAQGEVRAGISPQNGFYWKMDLAFEKVTEFFNKDARQAHIEERIAEAEQAMNVGEGAYAEEAFAQIREQDRERIRNMTATRERLEKAEKDFGEKFQINAQKLTGIADKLNEQYGGSDVLQDMNVILHIKMKDGTTKDYTVVVADKKIQTITEGAPETFDAELTLSQGEVYSLQNRNRVGMIAVLNRIRLQDGSRLTTQTVKNDISAGSQTVKEKFSRRG